MHVRHELGAGHSDSIKEVTDLSLLNLAAEMVEGMGGITKVVPERRSVQT